MNYDIRTRWKIGIGTTLLLVSLMHFLTPVHLGIYHNVYDRLFYIPIIFSAFLFGFRGGAATAVISGIILLLHLLFQWRVHVEIDLTGRYLEIAMYLVVGVITGVLSDMEKSQRRKAERAYEQLVNSFEKAKESERLAAIGMVAAGVAHEIRNPLGGIKGAFELVAEDIPPDSPKTRFVEIVEKEIKRMEVIVGDFLKFARPPEPQFSYVDINGILDSVLDLSRKKMSVNRITLRKEMADNMPRVYADPNQLKQVFLNIILNGIDAMQDGGTLEVVSEILENGKCVKIRIIDSGVGIEPGKEKFLVEPFYTTKETGTGLGLPIVKKIVEKHGGTFVISNRQDRRGTVVRVQIPVGAAAVEGGGADG